MQYQCDNCNATFNSPNALSSHHRRNVCPGEPLECTECRRTFRTRRDFGKHQHVHASSQPKCLQCDETFTHESYRKQHMTKGHTESKKEPRNYICPVCSKPFKDRMSFWNHRKYVHVDPRNPSHNCVFCDATFRRPGDLRIHERGVHDLVVSIHTIATQPDRPRPSKHFAESSDRPSAENGKVAPRRVSPLQQQQIRPLHTSGCVLPEVRCPTSSRKSLSHLRPIPNVIAVRHYASAGNDHACQDCGKSFPSPRSLGNHRHYACEKAMENAQWTCNGCRKKFLSKDGLQEHQEFLCTVLANSGCRSFRCNDCGTLLKSKRSLIRHQGSGICTGGPFKCAKCPYTCHSHHEFLRHQKLHTQAASQCPACFGLFSFKSSLVRHVRLQHSETRARFACGECPRTYSSLRELQRHHRSVHTGVRYRCSDCDVQCNELENLKKHMRRFGHGRPSTPSRQLSAQHMCQVSIPKESSGDFSKQQKAHFSTALNPARRPKSAALAFMHFTFGRSNALGTIGLFDWRQIVHFATQNGTARQHVCKACSGSFVNRQSLTYHQFNSCPVSLRERNVQCEYCFAKFASLDSIQEHQKDCPDSPTSGKGTYQCLGCDRYYSSQSSLRLHTSRCPRRPLQCPHCGRSFQRKADLESHVRIHETASLWCKACKRPFKGQSGLTQHNQRFHSSGELVKVEYKCSLCKKAFGDSTHRWRHEKEVHRTTPLTWPYQCDHCDATFKSRDAKAKHVRLFHS